MLCEKMYKQVVIGFSVVIKEQSSLGCEFVKPILAYQCKLLLTLK